MGDFFVYNINNTKSSILFLNEEERINPVIKIQLCNAKMGLIIWVLKLPIKIQWMTMHISIIGRINIIEMNVLTKFLYLFQPISLPLPKVFFHVLNSNFCKFIGNTKKKSKLRLRKRETCGSQTYSIIGLLSCARQCFTSPWRIFLSG